MVVLLKRFSIAFLIFLLLLSPFSVIYADDFDQEEFNIQELELVETTAPVNSEVKLNSRAAIVYERNSQMVLYEKNVDTTRPMASTTKIMTAIVVIQNADLKQVATISRKAANTGGSVVGFNTGDKITVNDLLYGLMLKSGNDAAVALAETVGGSVEGFADMMNKKAEELGLMHTHFVTPHGLDSDEHYTTAKELALLTDYALKIPKFKEIVNTHSYTLTINGNSRQANNTNELLGYLNGVYGVKTGFTNKAGRCLVTSTKRGNMDIVCVVLGADTKKIRTQDSIKLIEYSFNNFQLVDLKDKFNETFMNLDIENNISVIKGKNSVKVELEDISTLVAVRNSDVSNIEICVNYTDTITAPVEKSNVLGSITAKVDDNILLSQNIFLKYDINKKGIFDYVLEMFRNYSLYLELVL